MKYSMLAVSSSQIVQRLMGMVPKVIFVVN